MPQVHAADSPRGTLPADHPAPIEVPETGLADRDAPPDSREAQAARRRILAPVRAELAAASVLQCVGTMASVAPYIVIVELARSLLAGAEPGRVWALAGIALAFLGLRGLMTALALLWSHMIDVRYQYDLRSSIARKLSRLPLGWFSEHSSGDVKKHVQDDVHSLHHLVAHAQLDLVAAVTSPVLVIGYLAWVDWRVALAVLAPLVIYLVILGTAMSAGLSEKFARYNDDQARVNAAVVEFLDGISVVRTFGNAHRAHARYRNDVESFARNLASWSIPVARLQGAMSILLHPVFVLLVAVVTALLLAARGSFAPVDIVPFLMLGLGLGSTILTLGNGTTALQQAGVAAARLIRLEDSGELPDSPAAAVPGPARGLVEYRDVTFSYDGHHDVLHGVSFTLAPGTITALVGGSGSGKSTIASLLPRFHDVAGGQIVLDGIDLRELPLADLYRRIGFVFQQVQLVSGTVRENIALARPDASDADILAAAGASRIHDRILQLPRGYDSVVGDDALLSGGEEQRVALARALLADTPLVVLDEATAFADPESEAQIQDALSTLLAGRTVLVIAHRLNTISDVDQILVLQQGRIAERGTHRELVAGDGVYRRLWELQARPSIDDTREQGAES